MTDPCTENDGGTQTGPGGVTVEKSDCGVTITVQVKCGCGGGGGIDLGDLTPPPDSTVVPSGPPSPDFPRERILRDVDSTWTAFRLDVNGIWPWANQSKWQSSFRVRRVLDSRELGVWAPAEFSRSLALFRGFGVAPLSGWSDLTASLTSSAGGAYRPIKVEAWPVKMGAILAKPHPRGAGKPPGLSVSVTYKFTSSVAAAKRHFAVVMPMKPASSLNSTLDAYQRQGAYKELVAGTIEDTANMIIDDKVVTGQRYAVFIVRSDLHIFEQAVDADVASAAEVIVAP